MIQINHVYKEYENGEKPLIVLNDISFTILDTDFVVILGPSGSGKSTLLNCISGLAKVQLGAILYDDVDITLLKDQELTEFRRKTTAFVFQSYFLMPSLTVLGNVKMGANLAPHQKVHEIIERVGLAGKENKLPSELSGGERQRVSIARAIAKQPKVLFCDEPTGALDEATGRNILNYIIENKQALGYAVVMVTHNENIAQLANKIIRMNSGKIIEIKENVPKTVAEIRW